MKKQIENKNQQIFTLHHEFKYDGVSYPEIAFYAKDKQDALVKGKKWAIKHSLKVDRIHVRLSTQQEKRIYFRNELV